MTHPAILAPGEPRQIDKFKIYCAERGINPAEAEDSTTVVSFENEIRQLMDTEIRVADILPPGQARVLKEVGILTTVLRHDENRINQERFRYYLSIGERLRGPPIK